MARPIKLDRKIANDIVGILQIPQSIETACLATGISERTFYNWQKRGASAEKKHARGDELTTDEAAFLQFFQDTKKGNAVGKVVLLQIIQKAAQADPKDNPKSWMAAAWLLERKFPQEFGRKLIRVEQSGPDGGPIDVNSTGPAPVVNLIIEADADEPK